MQLRELQQEMQRHLFGAQSPIASAIADAPPLSVAQRLSIYQNAYRVRLIDALAESYPVLHAVLGDDDFAALAEQFIAAIPSVHRSLRWYGAELAEFLAVNLPWSEQPIFAELALLEWTLGEVFDSTDAESVPRSALAAVEPQAWSGLRFAFHPSLRRLHLQWNTVPVWRAMSRGESPPDPECAENAMPWLLWRQNLQNYFRSMAGDEAAALEAALAGATFGEMCEALGAWLPAEEVPLRAASLMGAWADSGIIVSLERG
jgi:hypothetical protein